MSSSPNTSGSSSRKTIRVAAIIFALLAIGMGIPGIFGVWWVERIMSGVALKSFGLVETAAGVVDAGVARVEDLIATSRTEVRQAGETIASRRSEADSPALKALSERLERSLTPRIAQMRQAMIPVRDAAGTAGDVVNLLNSLPMMSDRAPRLAALDESFDRLEELSADATQLRGALRTLAEGQGTGLPDEPLATISGLTQRIDTRLVEVQSRVQEVQADITALQVRLDARKSRVLFVFKLAAALATLMLAWVIYSQFVVIRHHRTQTRRPAAGPLSEA